MHVGWALRFVYYLRGRSELLILMPIALCSCSIILSPLQTEDSANRGPVILSYKVLTNSPTRSDVATIEVACSKNSNFGLRRIDEGQPEEAWRVYPCLAPRSLAEVPLLEGDNNFEFQGSGQASLMGSESPQTLSLRKRYILRNEDGSMASSSERSEMLALGTPSELQMRALADSLNELSTNEFAQLWALPMSAEARRIFVEYLGQLIRSEEDGADPYYSYFERALAPIFFGSGIPEGHKLMLDGLDFRKLEVDLNSFPVAMKRLGYAHESEMIADYNSWTENSFSTLEECALNEGYSDLLTFIIDWWGGGAQLNSLNLSRTSLKNSNWVGLSSSLNNNYSYADIGGARFGLANFSGATFKETVGFDVSLLNNSPDLSGLNVEGMDLIGLDVTGKSLRGANLSNATGIDGHILETASDLASAQLRGLNLEGLDLSGRNISYTDFSDTSGLDVSKIHLASNSLGAKFTNVDFSEFAPTGSLDNFDFSGIKNLSASQLNGATSFERTIFNGLDMTGFDPTGKSLRRADFSNTINLDVSVLNTASDLRNVNLSGLDLTGFVPTGKALSGANLSNTTGAGAGLQAASVLDQINFTGADLTGLTSLSGKSVAFSNLTNVTGIDGTILNDVSIHFYGMKFEGFDLTGFNQTYHYCYGCDFRGALNFQGSMLNGWGPIARYSYDAIQVSGLDLSGWNPNGRSIDYLDFRNTTGLTAAMLNNASSMKFVNLSGLGFKASDFPSKDLTGVIGLVEP